MLPDLKWLFGSSLAVLGLSALVGHLPPRARLLLLLAIGFGLLAGWSCRVIAGEFSVPTSQGRAIIVLLLTIAGLANVAWTAYRQMAAAARAITDSDPQQLMALRVLESAQSDDAIMERRYREERARLQPTFGDYLADRLTGIGRPDEPWPAAIWGAEILLGGVAAAWMFKREVRRQTPAEKSEIRMSKSEAEHPGDPT